ncbi:putative ubiquitin-specific protease [Phytophthora cinnamomi]|uniref:putative ubiquitin-specific protease n=1 Tax=Phytophthora cinnamomi TaxID=4785 RepID=UPI00355AC334|nr:putative ubiquitin-specific protease [Phytophthora cinnamomi]
MERVSTPVSPSRSPRSDIHGVSSMISSLRMSSQEEPLGESSLNDFAGVDDWEPSLVVIESVTLPAHSIVKTKTGATSYTIEVQLRGGQEWVVEKRYSDLRRLHDRLKSIGAPVRHLRFPAKSYVRNLSASALERWRRELEAYLTELLGIRPVLRWELFNFLGVYVNVREFERLWRGLANEEIDGLVERRAEEFKRRRLSSEDGYFGETSPATNSVSSGSVQAQSDTDSLMVGSSTYLEDLVEMCRGMDELQGDLRDAFEFEAITDRDVRMEDEFWHALRAASKLVLTVGYSEKFQEELWEIEKGRAASLAEYSKCFRVLARMEKTLAGLREYSVMCENALYRLFKRDFPFE